MVCGKSLRFFIHKFETSQEGKRLKYLSAEVAVLALGLEESRFNSTATVLSLANLWDVLSPVWQAHALSIEYASKTRKDEELIMLQEQEYQAKSKGLPSWVWAFRQVSFLISTIEALVVKVDTIARLPQQECRALVISWIHRACKQLQKLLFCKV